MKNKKISIYEIGIFLVPLSAHFISTTTKKGGNLPISSWHNQFKQTKIYTHCVPSKFAQFLNLDKLIKFSIQIFY
jgi:hypothetical protein